MGRSPESTLPELICSMKPKLACADFTFPLLTHDKSLDLIAMLDFEGVDIGLFEGRSHLWPSRVFEDVNRLGRASSGGKLGDRGLRTRRRLPPDRARLRLARPEPPRPGAAPAGARLVLRGRSSMPRPMRLPARLGAARASTSKRRAASRLARPAAATSWPGAARQAQRRADHLLGVEAHVGSIVPDARRPPPSSSHASPG